MSVLDITCPRCGRVDPVEKVGLGQYRCRECGKRFSREDLEVAE